MNDPVKGKTEAGRRREARALDTRRRIVNAALHLFLERGYAATTVEAIAREAAVAPATVYQAFGTKYAILASAVDVTVAGDFHPVAILERDWVHTLRAEEDPLRRLEIAVHHTAMISARTAAMKEVLRDAAGTEPQVRELIAEDTRRRYQTQRTLVQLVFDPTSHGDGAEHLDAAATFFALVNSNSYQLLVGELGWTFQQWERWLIAILRRELLEVVQAAQ
jgi:AcrR family transcriptional regulator